MRRAPRVRSPGVRTVYSRYQPRSRAGSSRSRLPNTTPSRGYGKGPPLLIRAIASRASFGSRSFAMTPSERPKALKARTSKTSPAISLTGAALLFGLPQPDVQLAQLALGDGRRRAGDEVLATLRLGERDDVANRLRAGHQGHQPVETEGDAAVRRRAVLQRLQQEAELGLLLLGRD